MDATADDELRELRARAYGPRADIASDPAAMRRLQELESARMAAPVRREHARSTPEPSPAPAAEGDAARSDRGEGWDEDSLWDDEGAAPETSGRFGWTARRQALLWAASVVVTAVIAAAITYTLVSIPMFSASAQAPQIATLELTRTGAVPPGWFGAEEDVAAVEFYGLTLFATAGWVSESGDRSSESRCLNATPTEDVPPESDPDGSSYTSGRIYGTCSVGSFPAAFVMPIDGESPGELVDRYPSGTALQFVLDGDRVRVFLDSGSD
ncbi:hypothetical protein ACIP5T_13090 [Microbacterium sp. NPDC088619]|uniref:hypothetical protein n=1 Tax=Microbacterium sp. NPDC088619 TaxID=3364196 RepID=UPI00382215A9